MEEQRFWSRGDTGMTELLGVTAKIRSLRLSSKSSKMWHLYVELLHEDLILQRRVLEWINLVTWSVNGFQFAIIFGIVRHDADCCANLDAIYLR